MQPAGALFCPRCARAVEQGWRLCPECGAKLIANADGETNTFFTAGSSSSSAGEGRFPAGVVLAGRYKILGLIGRGGMGEVYRACDLILNQAVALKFLVQGNVSEAALARFRNEVRIARQVSHPNVCRVYDIGFVEGSHFLSMEYLDGEDLASLLRRIGRLPGDKAIEFARKICAGLSAAHERGVLHRDLKPANIMIDGRGQVRITDFGLAALAQAVALGDIRSGTPAYMSPEQKAGKEVTARSDIYSLGLTFYEMFTGRHRGNTATDPSEIVKDLDPAVERVILRCLEEDPKRRPASALQVAMALPGGDPIAAALAAGETPSPEMVAASTEKSGFQPRTAALCLAFIVAAMVFVGLNIDRFTIPNHARLEVPPEALAFRAQDILKKLGYSAKPKASGYGFDYVDRGYVRYLNRTDPARLNERLAAHRPAVISFWYRQHQGDFQVDSFLSFGYLVNGDNDVLGYDSPANTDPGMIRLRLDPVGRLIALEVRPATGERGSSAAPDWSKLLAAAEFDMAGLTTVAPRAVPPVPFDARTAWEGPLEPGGAERVHLEAAGWQGKAVFFSVGGDWQQKGPADVAPYSHVYLVTLAVFLPCYFGGAAILSWQNLRKGRGDRRGALQLATAVFLAAMVGWGFSAAHVASLWEFHLLVKALSWALLMAAAFGSLYLGVEPHFRRHWPDSLISWSRLQAGKITDPGMLACAGRHRGGDGC
jgi:serine/threonine protein kinase